ncbi:class I SAM-dependent methyltransferase [Elioraea sp.]|uniref:class I SAM-dependent methyltransferase n=1 Tax=Elioraea sp. TaxID=2185103 RepID=UPI0021DC3086|nr:class I SAM-dependent methyltransferase [Elioraea sp.]GIX10022.1 MAG: cyclopropane-fatty-acyl-phospholipid synthase [Elioraea sp.]
MSRDRIAESARTLAALVAEAAPSSLALRLWTGETLKLGPAADGAVGIAINTPAALVRLVRRPRLTTLIELIAAGAVEIHGGTLLDIEARRGRASRGAWRRLPKGKLLRALWPLLVARGARLPPGGHGYRGTAAARLEDGRDDAALVRFHYDLSNAFYALFLDPEMQYSCAYFPDWEAPLEVAQRAKLEMTCRRLRLAPGERFLDIGCGWGGLICHAAQWHGVRAHGVTLSEQQYAFVREKIARLGLSDRVTVALQDYREVAGEWDKIASVGMFEHVGRANHATYFRKMRDLLRPRGLLLNHAITRPAKKDERAFRRKRAEYAALTRYIFPGGELDHIGRTLTSLEQAGFEVHDVEGWREHYARTCRLWTERLAARRAEAEAEVGPAKTRLWLLYLAGCALAFDRGGALIYQVLASKRARGASGLPPTRADLYR